MTESLDHAKRLFAQAKFTQVLKETSELLRSDPSNEELLFLHAVTHKHLGHHKQHKETLMVIVAKAPEYARAHQELGFVYINERELAKALRSFQLAVEADAALIDSWNALIGLHRMQANEQQAMQAEVHFKRLRALPDILLRVSSLINQGQGQLEVAEKLCRSYLEQNAEDVEAIRLLALIGLKLDVLDDAQLLLERALEIAPAFDRARFDYVGVLEKRQSFEQAYRQAKLLLEKNPRDYNFVRLYANCCMQVSKHEQAVLHYKKVLEIDKDNAEIHLQLAHAYKTLGKTEAAIQHYQEAHRLKPYYGDAYWSLVNLKTYRLSDEELDQAIEAVEQQSTAAVDRVHLLFAVAKALADRQQVAASFDYYQQANRLRKAQISYQVAETTSAFQRQMKVFDSNFIAARDNKGHLDPAPIFIVGMPRSGSTLIEQILASHSKVDGTLELPNIISIVRQLNGRLKAGENTPYPEMLRDIDDDGLQELGQQYLNMAKIYRGDAAFFTDKMPNNFVHIGLIKLILPQAKIIDARRQAMSCCWSNYTQYFAEGQAYTYDFSDLAKYYADYVGLMHHWDDVFKGNILRVEYEDVVQDQEKETRRLLDYCGLEFESACLDFHLTNRAVQTPSSEQVRQPINRKGIEAWRKFEPYLETLKTKLREQGLTV